MKFLSIIIHLSAYTHSHNHKCVCTHIHTDNADSAAFAGFVSTLNRQLKPLSMEIANARMEDSDVRWYGLVNRTPDNAAKFGTKYALAELEFFNKVVSIL